MEERQDQGQPGWGDQTGGQPMPQPGPYPYQGAPQYYQPPAAAPVKARPRWKTPVIAGVALVVGIAIGAAAGGGSKNSPSTTGSASGATASSSAAPASAAAVQASSPAAVAPATSVVLTLSGNGQKTTKKFTIAHGDWSLAYTYDCAAFGSTGNFQVYEDYPSGDILANELGAKGGQTTYQHGDSGSHSLEVNSECAWTLKVTDGDGG